MSERVEVEFSPAEIALLKSVLKANADKLRERWGVDDLAGLVRLLAMHGADEIDGLA